MSYTKADEIRIFSAPDGRSYLFFHDFPGDGEILYSVDGTNYFALEVEQRGGVHSEDDNREYFTVTDPHHGDVSWNIGLINGVVVHNEDEFTLVDTRYSEDTLVQTMLTQSRMPRYLFGFEDSDQLLYVSVGRYNLADGQGWKAYIGSGSAMTQLSETGVSSTLWMKPKYISTGEGMLFTAPSSDVRERPTWTPSGETDPQVLIRLDTYAYDIVETLEGELTITKKYAY